MDSSSEELGTFWKLWNVFMFAGDGGFLAMPGAAMPAVDDPPEKLCEFLNEAAPRLCKALR